MPPVIRRYADCPQPVQRLAAVQYQTEWDDFVLTPKASNGNLKQFTIKWDVMAQSISLARWSRTISAELSAEIPAKWGCGCSEIYLHPPQGVTVDDQRK